MSRFVVSTIAIVAGFFMTASASAAQPVGIDALTAKGSPLVQGEAVAFFLPDETKTATATVIKVEFADASEWDMRKAGR